MQLAHDAVVAAIATVLGRRTEEINVHERLVNVGDSLRIVEINMMIEESLDISMSDADERRFTPSQDELIRAQRPGTEDPTIEDLIRLFGEKLAA